MSNYVELEIQNLLNSMSDSTELPQVGQKLIEDLEKSEDQFTSDNIKIAALFLLNAGLNRTLIDFYLRHCHKPTFHLPWSHLLEALASQKTLLTKKTISAIQEGLFEMEGLDEASHSEGALGILPELKAIRSLRLRRASAVHQDGKKALLEQLATLRTQQLYQQEKSLLARLQKLYPGDPDISNELQEYKQRYALEILQKHTPQNRQYREEPEQLEPSVEKALIAMNKDLLLKAEQYPEVAIDLVVLAVMIESYEAALQLLEYCEETPSSWWLRMEVLLRCRRYLELLTDLSKIEVLLAHDAETFFASAYLRAQALWGLGQKHSAIEVLEGLLAARPHYRAASSLLGIWSQG